MPRLRPTLLLSFVATVATVASAEPSAIDRASAQQLFDDAKRLVDEGRYADACPKYAASLRLDAGLGTMLRLADCYEKVGQTASAWATFLDALDAAHRAGDAREKVAKERADALAPRVPHLVVNVADATIQGLVVKRDGEALDRALLGAAAPIDPGKHTIEASAPGRRPHSTRVDVPPGGATVTVEIPALAPAAAPSIAAPTPAPPASTAERPPPETERSPSIVPYVVGGGGVAIAITGTILVFAARSKHDAAVAACQTGTDAAGPYRVCGSDAQAKNDGAKSLGTIGAVGLGLGGAMIAAGAVLLFARPKDTHAALSVSPAWVAGGGGVSAQGAF